MARAPQHTSRLLAGGGVAVIVVAAVMAVAEQGPGPRIDLRVGVAPTAVTGSDGETHLAYELNATDLSGTKGARLERVDVFGDLDPKPLVRYAGDDLEQRVMRPDADPKVRYGRLIRSGTTALIHVWVTLARDQPLPKTLRHSFVFRADDGTEINAGDAAVEIRAAPPLVVGPPFRTGIWLAHNGPGNHGSAHWGSALVTERVARVPQRFAIDFIGVDSNGGAVRGDFRKSTNDAWVGFGHEILAVTDGVVHAARDGLLDNPPLAELPPARSPSAADTYGNYVIVAMDGRTFVHYAHLRRNSVRVKTGEAVRRGQVIGRLGNSGNTNGAHLHFNITDNPAPEAAQGLPFVFDAFESRGKTTAAVALGAERSSGARPVSPSPRGKELPLDGTVVRFP